MKNYIIYITYIYDYYIYIIIGRAFLPPLPPSPRPPRAILLAPTYINFVKPLPLPLFLLPCFFG